MRHCKHYHTIILGGFVVTILFGIFFIATMFYSAYQDVIVIDCSAEKVTLGGYKFHKDKRYGGRVQVAYLERLKTGKCSELYYAYKRNNRVRTDWLLQHIDIILTNADMYAKETALYIYFGMQKYTRINGTGHKFPAWLKCLKPAFRAFRQVVMATSQLEFVAYSSYLALNTRNELVSRRSMFRTVLHDFGAESFYTITYIGNKANSVSIGTKHSVRYNGKNLTMLIVTNKCAGEKMLMLRYFDYITRNQSNTLSTITSCLPPKSSFKNADITKFDTDTNCLNIMGKTFEIFGDNSGNNGDECKHEFSLFFTNQQCKSNTNSDCITLPSMNITNFEAFITNGPFELLSELRMWRYFSTNSGRFADKYREARKFLCETDISKEHLLEGLNQRRLALYCWRLTYYEVILEQMNYPLESWKDMKLALLDEGTTKGIAILEADSNRPRLVFPLLGTPARLYATVFLFLVPFYLWGMAELYHRYLDVFRRRYIFVKFFRNKLYLVRALSRAKIKRKTKHKKKHSKRK